MASSEILPARPIRRRLFFGYDRDEVDDRLESLQRSVAEAQDELARAREAADTTEALGHHLASMLTRFAEAVTAGEREASDRAAAIIVSAEARAEAIETQARELLAQARDLASATYAEAGRRYDAAVAARRIASERIESAIESMADVLMSIRAVPDFPDLTLPVPELDQSTNVVSFDRAS